MKTIGVLGGIGPQATMDFEARVHAISQQLVPAHANQGYPPMVVFYHRRPPVLLAEDGSPLMPLQLDPGLADAARRLGGWADFLVITSNGAHRCREQIEAAAGRPVVSMIDATLDEVRRRGVQKAGLLTLGEPAVYREPLEQLGIGYEALTAGMQARLDGVILPFMAGQTGPAESAVVEEAVTWLRARGADCIILGCTELPLLLGDRAPGPDLINPTQLLAEATVRAAIA